MNQQTKNINENVKELDSAYNPKEDTKFKFFERKPKINFIKVKIPETMLKQSQTSQAKVLDSKKTTLENDGKVEVLKPRLKVPPLGSSLIEGKKINSDWIKTKFKKLIGQEFIAGKTTSCEKANRLRDLFKSKANSNDIFATSKSERKFNTLTTNKHISESMRQSSVVSENKKMISKQKSVEKFKNYNDEQKKNEVEKKISNFTRKSFNVLLKNDQKIKPLPEIKKRLNVYKLFDTKNKEMENSLKEKRLKELFSKEAENSLKEKRIKELFSKEEIDQNSHLRALNPFQVKKHVLFEIPHESVKNPEKQTFDFLAFSKTEKNKNKPKSDIFKSKIFLTIFSKNDKANSRIHPNKSNEKTMNSERSLKISSIFTQKTISYQKKG